MTETPEPIALTPRFVDALVYAERIHAGQIRKGTGIPYISHPLAVASIALEHGANETEAIAALLHDAIEDSPDPVLVKEDIRRRFGTNVAVIVEGCSDSESQPKPPWRERKERYLAHLREASSSIRPVSAADKLHNARAILEDYRDVGEALWERFNAKKEGTLWYYRALAGLFIEAGPPRLAAELNRVVAEIESLSTLQALPDRDVRALQKRIIAGLTERYVSLTGGDLNDKRQVPRARDAVVPTVPDAALGQSLADVRRGSGGELTSPKSGGHPDFHSVRSSCALAVSVFGPWRLQPANLELAGWSGFTELQFEVQFPILDTASKFKTPPNLDVVGWRLDHVVAVESKFVEQVTPEHTASFDALYDTAIEAAHPSWNAKVKLLRASPDKYHFFNAAQIVKHYLGLKADRPRLIQGRPTTLLYLFWEPENPEIHRFFGAHRAEVEDFATGLADTDLSFRFLSYRELWAGWKTMPSPDLRRHVSALEARYLLKLAAYTPA